MLFAAEQQSRFDDWLRVHRLLLDRERRFGEMALQAAAGTVSLAQLQEERDQLMALRELCVASYAKAFPGAGVIE